MPYFVNMISAQSGDKMGDVLHSGRSRRMRVGSTAWIGLSRLLTKTARVGLRRTHN